MSKTKKQLKEKICQLRTELANAIKISNAHLSQLSAAQQSIKKMQGDLDYTRSERDLFFAGSKFHKNRVGELEAEKQTLLQHHEKPWTWITDDPDSLPKESGWYQIYHETDTYPYPVMPCFYSEGALDKGFILAWKPMSEPPQRGES